jgi:acyl transferase domain-containing protein/phosphopantetheinyl transferase
MDDIAIIGMAALFPGARNLETYWNNILNGVDAVTDAPDSWASPYFDPDSRENDRIYSRKGGFLGDLAHFDPTEYGVMPSSIDGGEPDHFLALKLAFDALKDAGYADRAFPRDRTGIVLGRGTYINRGYTNLLQHGMMVDQTLELIRSTLPDLSEDDLSAVRQSLKASLPPFNAEMSPGLVPNVITGRIANRLDLMGPNYIIDAACASSLIAIELAVRDLRDGRCDMMLAGGVHASTPPQINMIFTQLGALSHTRVRPFDAAANGTLLGEGLGVVVLKRLRDAEADGDRIYAVIKGLGSSSDGRAMGLLAPRLEGEVMALRRAYEDARVEPGTVGLVEAHGTGIALGDQTEVRSLTTVFGARAGELPFCALGSVKSMISHCIPAAGAAALIKTALALHHKILPPTLCENVNPALQIETTPFYINTRSRPWIHGGALPRRAGVNAFGFGGVNAHAVLEEYRPNQPGKCTLLSDWPSELLIFSGETRGDVLALLDRAEAALERPDVSLAGLARALAARAPGPCRLAVPAKDGKEFKSRLKGIRDKLAAPSCTRLALRTGVSYGEAGPAGDVVFLFPGEGAQYPNMLADLCLYFPKVREWFDLLDEAFAAGRAHPPSAILFPAPTGLTEAQAESTRRALYSMDTASESVFVASRALFELLSGFGIRANIMLGHSTGEFASLTCSGVARVGDRDGLIAEMRSLNRLHGELEESGDIPRGALMTVGGVSESDIAEVVAELSGAVYLAMDNCSQQKVFYGEPEAIARAEERLKDKGAICLPLPFDRAYHTPLFARVSEVFRRFYDGLDVGAGATRLYSCASAGAFPDDPDAIRALAASQWARPVRFREAIESLHDNGARVFVEIGPSSNLTAFVDDILKSRDYAAVSTNNPHRPSMDHFLAALGRLFALGLPVDFAPLFADRQLPPFDLDADSVASPGKRIRSLRLELDLPRMQLSETVIARLRARLAPAAPPAAPAPAMAVSSPAATTATIPPGAPADPRAAALEAHFGLMREFLSSQTRVMSALAHPLAGIAQPLPAAAAAVTATADFADRYPLLGRVIEQAPDRLRCERRFDLVNDLFLHDHTLGGKLSDRQPGLLPLPVIPFTVSMEMLAEAAHLLAGEGLEVSGLSNLRGYRWLTLDLGEITLRISAKALESLNPGERVVGVQIHQHSDTAAMPDLLVFEGDVVLSDRLPARPVAMELDLPDAATSRWPDHDLYRTGMFHGPRFQGVKHLRRWGKAGIEADLEIIPTGDFIAGRPHARFLIDAGLLDAAGQLVGYWVSEKFGTDFNVFPFQVVAFRKYGGLPGDGARVLCRGKMGFIDERQTQAQFDFLDAEGRLLCRLEGWQDRYFSVPHHYYECRLHPQTAFLSQPRCIPGTEVVCRELAPFPEHFLDDSWAIWKRVLAHLVLTPVERQVWYSLPEQGARRTDWLMGRIAAKEALRVWVSARHGIDLAPVDIEIRGNHLGKPVAECRHLAGASLPDISISHSGGHAIAVAASQVGECVGIDLERFDPSHQRDALEQNFCEDERALARTLGHHGILSCWCAREAAAKAAGTGLAGRPEDWRVGAATNSAELLVAHDRMNYHVYLSVDEAGIIALCEFRL